MRAAGLAEPTHEHLVRTVEKDHLDLVTLAFERREGRLGAGEELARAHVDPKANTAERRPGNRSEELRRKRGWKVIDAIKTEVLKDTKRGAASRTGKAGHDDDIER